ncbi:MAG TPA: penicillin-binding protein 2, partial [Fimbriimonas sp.]|nr:penicillin-binding protein 2 [Fimbriimonas sp.]
MSRAAKKQVVAFHPGSIVMLAMFGVAGLSQLKLQTIEAESTVREGEKSAKYTVTKIDKARRGTLYTRDNAPLVTDSDSWMLSVNFAEIPKVPGFAVALSEATGIPSHEFTNKEKGSRSWPDPLTPVQRRAVSKVKKAWDADGISIERADRRSYPMGYLAGGLTGYYRVSNDAQKTVSMSGLEASLNEEMKGHNGKQTGLMDNHGEFLPLRSDDPSAIRKDGAKIVTTIDSNIQTAAALSVRKAVEENKADDGVAIVVAPRTGEVLAMATWPCGNPNDTGNSKYDGKNPAYKTILEPGSTFKIFTMAKAYDAGKLKPGDTVNCQLTLGIDSKSAIHCDRAHGAHGVVDAEAALAKSCNVAAAIWALKVGQKDFYGFLGDLGLRSKSEIEINGEAKNQMAIDPWARRLQTATWGFGQSMNVTPISLARALCVIANGGHRVPLTLLRSVDGKEVMPKIQSERVLSEEACKFTLDNMKAVMQHGTGQSLQIAGFDMGGKTGTAQKLGKGGSGGYVSNFVGVIPAENPEAVVLVMINN